MSDVPPGEAIAAYTAAMLGILALSVVNVACAVSPGFEAWVHWLGTVWLPGTHLLGPYCGKELLSLACWLGSWAALHFLFARGLHNESAWLAAFALGVGLASTLLWPPALHWLVR